MICYECKTENRVGDKFCLECGAPLEPPAQQSPDPSTAATMMSTAASTCTLVRLGSDGGESYTLGNRVLVGRLDTCDLPINDKSVSREHARFSRLQNSYVVEDLGSTNGTLVNGTRITEAVMLQPGDIVTIGAIDFRFDREDESSAPAADGATPAPAASPFETAGPVTFPPLEPVAPPPVSSGFADSTDSSPPPPRHFEPEPPQTPPQTNVRNEEPAWPPPQPQSPFPLPSTVPERQPAPTPQPEPAAQAPSAPAAGSESAQFSEALNLVHQLSQMLQDWASQAGDAGAGQAQLQQLERREEKVRQALKAAPGATVGAEQLQSIQDLLDALIQNPRDIELLLKVGQHAADLASVVNENGQLRRAVEEAKEASGA